VSSVGGKRSIEPTNEDINSSNLFQRLIASILADLKFDIVIYLLYRQIFVFNAIRARVGTVSMLVLSWLGALHMSQLIPIIK
jgi:hypothetical protein